MNTIVVKCSCKNDYQDKCYGKNLRVANVGEKLAKCTVCGAPHKNPEEVK